MTETKATMLARLKVTWPGWRIDQVNGGLYRAVRRDTDPALFPWTLTAETLPGLETELLAQSWNSDSRSAAARARARRR